MQQNCNKKRKLNRLKAILFMLLVYFFVPAMAQVNTGDNYQVYMKEGNSRIARDATNVRFYDDHGPSYASDGIINYWDRWYATDKHYTYVFRPKTAGDKIKVTFKKFHAYEWSDTELNNCHDIGEFALRINDDVLKVYNSDGAVQANLIAELTGTVEEEFTIMADGPMTFEFISNEQYREEGWGAEVTAVTGMTVQKPLIHRSTCSDDILLIPTMPGATLYYTTDGSDPSVPSKDPLSAGILYTGPIEWPVGGNITIKAIAVLGDQESGVTAMTFVDPDDRMPTMQDKAPQLGMVAGTNTVRITCPAVPKGLNETFYVVYTTDGSDPTPTNSNGTKVFFVPSSSYTYPESLGITVHASTYEFEVTTPNTTVRAKTYGYSCSNLESPEAAHLTITTVLVAPPTLTFATTNATTGVGQATIGNIMSGARVYYTTDGSTPSSSNGTAYTGPFAVNPGQTVKVIAHIEGTGYTDSPVVTDTYMPEGGNGTYGGVVLLDDREPHSWSYYSDGDQPIHSLNPADVKITYFGNSPAGRTTMTDASENGDNPTSFSATATGVAVNVGEAGDQFIYLKTLENNDPEGEGNEYSYTMIPNPFQVRPTHEETGDRYILVTSAPSNGDWSGTYIISNSRYPSQALSTRIYYHDFSNWTGCYSTTGVGISNDIITDPREAAVFLVEKNDDGYYTFKTTDDKYLYIQYSGSGGPILRFGSIATSSNLAQWRIGISNDGAVSIVNRYVTNCVLYFENGTNGNYYTTNIGSYGNGNWLRLYKSESVSYRGFYAWRVKSLSSGLTIQRANGTSVGVGGYIDAEEEIKFVTDNEEGNEVEFEALWAKAWVTTTTTTSDLNPNVSYERNFMVLGSNPGSTSTTTQWPTTTTNTTNYGQYFPIYYYGADYPYSMTQQIYTPTEVGGAGTITQIAFYVQTRQNRSRSLRIYLATTSYNEFPYNSEGGYYRTIPIDDNLVYSGNQNFNATGWYTINLTTPFYYDGTSNLLVTICNNTSGTQSAIFRTYSTGGNRAAALSWNEAVDPTTYIYPADATITYNNQIRFTKAISNLAGINVPLTITTYNPDGTGGSTSVTLTDAITCGADLKFENIKMNAIPVLEANGHNMVVGRGVTPTSGFCATNVYGYNTTSDNTANVAVNTRIESGVFAYVRLLNAGDEETHLISGTTTVNATLGSDYDRAKNNNSLLSTYDFTLGYGIRSSSNDSKYNVVVKSGTNGTYGTNTNGRFYMGFDRIPTLDAHIYGTYHRQFTILGGEFTSHFAGGINGYMGPTTDPDLNAIKVRIKGGSFSNRVYMGGTRLPGYGNRQLIATGGTFSTFITGGCYGYDSNSGITYGTSDIYFGGKAKQTSTLGLFGSGYGTAEVYGTADEDSYYVTATKIVVADEAQVAGSVYGGGNNGYAQNGSDVYILGGTVAGNVYGGSNKSKGATVNMTMKDGTVSGNIYGGSNEKGIINGLATINVSGGTASNVFGGGYGSNTDMAAGTNVTVSGGTINNNVYGGGEMGTVTNVGTQVNIEGGTIGGSIFGAGKGATDQTALVTGKTEVNITGGNIAKSIYGGGEAGNVDNGTDLASTVTVNGAVTINENVFGGGMEGFTTGNVVVNLFQGNIRGHLFGGALGKQGSVYVGGQKTVNMTGGHVFGNVYGGSRNANDANALTGYSATEQATTCEVNISAGKIDQNLYGAGYFGHTYGSVNVYLGAEAITNVPNHTTIDEDINYTREGGLNIEGNIFAGSDWGDFTGDFGGSTISGMSNIYLDGTGYNSTSNSTSAANYMKAGLAIHGCGTSNDAGTTDRTLVVKNYGTAVADAGNEANPFSTATRQLLSIQRFKNVIFDNAHLLLTGQGKVNSLNITEKYGLYEDETVYLCNGSTMITNVPCSQMKSFQSVTCDNTYAETPTFSAVAIDGLGAVGSATDNKIRVNGGSYIEVKYEADGVTKPYGELKGWAHMMSSTNDQEATCAYARPKQSKEQGNIIPNSENNGNDGGFVSYDGIYNQYTADGTLVSTGNQDQIRYENHTPNMTKDDSQYFRIWRYGGNRTNMELVFDAHATGTEGYRTVDVAVTLPPFRSSSHYYRFETAGETPNRNTTTEYGSDVLTYNMACYNTTLDEDGVHGTPVANGYMYYQNGQQLNKTAADCPGKSYIDDNPDVNYGLVIMPNTSTAVNGSNYIICDASDNYLAELNRPFTCRDNTQAPEFIFRLTYNNQLSSNMTWDPMKVKLVQCDANGNITDYVTLDLVVVTSTTITQDFTTKVYAIMDGQGSGKDTYISKVILPTYDVQTAGENSTFTVKSVSFVPAVVVGSGSVTHNPSSNESFGVNSFGLAIEAADTYDKTNVWYSMNGHIDMAASSSPSGKEIGKESGRNEVGIDVVLYYSGLQQVEEESLMGTVTIEIEFDNYKDGDANHKGTLNIVVEVYRLGSGENYYVDGVNGKDETGYGHDPDKAAATVNYIFNRCNYRPGGNIFVVNTITVDKSETWNGARFNSVKMYRYPGMHKLSTGDYGTTETNPAFTGKLVEVTNELTLRGIVMDGMYAEATAANHSETQNLYPSEQGCNFDGQSVAPIINVAEGGRLNLKDGVVLQNNYNTTAAVTETSNPGGALSVHYGGSARMNEDAQITTNINAVGGGVWADGALIVSDNVNIYDNKIGTAATSRQSNVWLTEATVEQAKANVHYKVIQIGTSSTTDEYGPLANLAKIGVDKEDWGNTIEGFMPVVYAEDGTQDYLELPYEQPQTIIVHDANKYELEKYTDDNYLFWISTWVQKQDHQPTNAEEDGGVEWDDIDNITTANQFAWLISLINGENGKTPDNFAGKTIVINADLDLKAAIWVPINNFKGTLEGNGHVIQGLNSPLVKDNMGVFGTTDGATIKNLVAKVDFDGDAENVGSLIGSMKNTTLNNVEAAGDLEGKAHTKNLGGLVGKVESGTIKSSFSVNDMTASAATTVMGGLVGTNGGDIYNSFANTTMTGAAKTGGLVGVNDGHVENCYAVVGSQTFPAFANTNNGVITVCYADNANGYVATTGDGTSVDLSGHGTFGPVKGIKEIGYMYGDNLIDANTNDYVGNGTITYLDNHTPVWPGLLSALNQWVRGHNGYTSWARPTTQAINGDLPILTFEMDNCVGNLNTQAADGKMLRYSAYDPENLANNNGLDYLLGTVYKDQAANIYLYKSATNVVNGTGSNNLFIQEDAALLQAESSKGMAIINGVVGVTFDNSKRTAPDFQGNPTNYDWHLLSSPLKAAPMGTQYGSQVLYGAGANISKLEGNYLPNGLLAQSEVNWDLYTYYEPEYHWINFKRGSDSHWHYDEPHGQIEYENDPIFKPGKGYMMAISKDSYLSSSGTLNNDDVTVTLTAKAKEGEQYDRGSNLVGNPYHAYLDLVEVSRGTHFTKFYIYDADQGFYTPYTVNQSTNTVTPSRYIHPHQAFFVVKDANTQTEDFTLTYSMATDKTDDGSYFRGDEQVNYPLVNLFAENAQGNRDLTIIELNRPELGGAEKINNLRNSNFKIAAHLEGESYGILFTPEGTERVPVYFTTEEDGTFTLTWETMHGEFSSLLLVDNMTGTVTDMLRAERYTFDAGADDYASRFYITYRVTDVEEHSEGDGTFAWFDGSEWIVEGQGVLDVVDVMGRTVYSERLVNEKNRVGLNGVAKGVYLLRVSDGTNTMVQKIVVR